jgi:hypothetical protein
MRAVVLIWVFAMMLAATDSHAAWAAKPYYYIKQTTAAGGVRYNETRVPVGSDVTNVEAVPKTETTITTTWNSEPVYYIREIDGSKTRTYATDLLIRFVALPLTPEERLCKIQEALVFDPAFKGFKLQTNPTPTNTGNCTYLKFERKDNGQDVWGLYHADKIGADGKPYCPAD